MIYNMAMVLTKTTILASSFWLAILAQVPDPVSTGKSLGSLTTAEILGIVCVVSIFAMVMLYRDSRRDNERLYKVLEENTKMNQYVADTLSQNVGILVEIKDVIIKCKGQPVPVKKG